MRNRNEFGQSFKMNAQIPKIDKTPVKRKSCECSECGLVNKKMKYIGSIIQQFQPYFNVAYKLFENERKNQEKQTKIQQQKQLRLRNKRHNHNKDMLKRAVNVISFQETFTNNRKRNVELPPINMSSLKEIKNNQSSNLLQILPQRKMWDKRQTTIKFQYKQNIGHNQRCYLPATPLDSHLVFRINKVIYQSFILKHQQGTVDDFNFKLRINVFDEKQEPLPIKHQLLVPTIRQEEDYDEDESMVESIQQMPIKHKPNKDEQYKQILKYNKRSFANLVEQAQLTERKAIQNLIKINNSHKILPLIFDQQPLPIYMIHSNYLDAQKTSKSNRLIKLEKLQPAILKSQSQHVKIINKHKKNLTAGSVLLRL
ncbi:unnamed protein product [Paramecium primaurelia]|uniref:Uncharacterized protein n=1 Tax=Paramecium primaurelia TaxID=5886 RepID=A0A8S1JZD7_PARPR|nr:unnamed protein product [Paramecium primaurelia]CAD8045528.1 unnamed protein product [Paramecium primaurelia]